MRLESIPLLILTAALLFVSCGLITYLVLSAEDSAARRLFRRYTHRLDRHSGFLLMSRTGTEVARMQLIVGAPVAAFSLVARSPALTLVAAAIFGNSSLRPLEAARGKSRSAREAARHLAPHAGQRVEGDFFGR